MASLARSLVRVTVCVTHSNIADVYLIKLGLVAELGEVLVDLELVVSEPIEVGSELLGQIGQLVRLDVHSVHEVFLAHLN